MLHKVPTLRLDRQVRYRLFKIVGTRKSWPLRDNRKERRDFFFFNLGFQVSRLKLCIVEVAVAAAETSLAKPLSLTTWDLQTLGM